MYDPYTADVTDTDWLLQFNSVPRPIFLSCLYLSSSLIMGSMALSVHQHL